MPIVRKSGSLNLLEPSGLVLACNGITVPFFTSLNKAVLNAIRAEAANIRASYVSINSIMMGCMESNWMI
jgi:hypothetical protein